MVDSEAFRFAISATLSLGIATPFIRIEKHRLRASSGEFVGVGWGFLLWIVTLALSYYVFTPVITGITAQIQGVNTNDFGQALILFIVFMVSVAIAQFRKTK